SAVPIPHIHTLSLHDALPILRNGAMCWSSVLARCSPSPRDDKADRLISRHPLRPGNAADDGRDEHGTSQLLTQQAGPHLAIRGAAACRRSACWFCTARTCLRRRRTRCASGG